MSLQSVPLSTRAREITAPARSDRARPDCRHPIEAPRHIRVGLLGYGRVGRAVADVADKRRARLLDANVDVRCVNALVRNPRKPRLGPRLPLSTIAANVLESDIDVVVEVLGGLQPARELVALALDAGIPVVTANKTLVETAGVELQALANRRRTAFAFDAAVLAGVPFLGSLSRRPFIADAREIAGVLNGTSAFILSAMEKGASCETALAEAITRGYAEPDSAADVSGLDAAQKLSILLQLAGWSRVRAAAFPLASLTVLDPRDLAAARQLGGAIKPVAFAAIERERSNAWVGPAFVRDSHPFSRLSGVTNSVQLSNAAGETVAFTGPGAGPEITAATILDDIVEIFTGSGASSVAPGQRAARPLPEPIEPPSGEWFVRVSGLIDLESRHLAEFFAANGAPLLHVLTERDHLAGRTAPAGWPTIQEAIEGLRGFGARVVALPALESGPRD